MYLYDTKYCEKFLKINIFLLVVYICLIGKLIFTNHYVNLIKFNIYTIVFVGNVNLMRGIM